MEKVLDTYPYICTFGFVKCWWLWAKFHIDFCVTGLFAPYLCREKSTICITFFYYCQKPFSKPNIEKSLIKHLLCDIILETTPGWPPFCSKKTRLKCGVWLHLDCCGFLSFAIWSKMKQDNSLECENSMGDGKVLGLNFSSPEQPFYHCSCFIASCVSCQISDYKWIHKVTIL